MKYNGDTLESSRPLNRTYPEKKEKDAHTTLGDPADQDPSPSMSSSSHRQKPSGGRREGGRPLSHLHKPIGNHSPVEVAACAARRTQRDLGVEEGASAGGTPRPEQDVEPE